MGGGRGQLISKEVRYDVLALIEEATAHGARQSKACELLGISPRTIERWKKDGGLIDKRTRRTISPPNKLTEAERTALLNLANSKEYCDLPPSQIVPRLADEGCYIASESTFYRILRQKGQLARRGKSNSPKNHKPRELLATAPNKIWSWDITYLPTPVKGMFFYLYMILDVYSRKIIAWHVAEEESSELASQLAKKACKTEQVDFGKVTLHSDNGSPMKGATMLSTLQVLGVATSFSRPSVSNDNPFSESLFKTLKYDSSYPSKPFETVEKASLWVKQFVDWYNYQHRHSSIRFVSPHQRHGGEDHEILAQRKKVYELAKKQKPQRWSGNTRNWTPVKEVWLNKKKPPKTTHNCKDCQEDRVE